MISITVKSGGCAGMTYDANIVTGKDVDEKNVYRNRDITVITDDLISAGFRFNNRSNESSCGCGGSFSVSGFPLATC